MTYPPDILWILVVFVTAPLSWIVAVLLWRMSRSAPELSVLRERAIAATAMALIVTMFAIVFINNSFFTIPPLNLFETQVITRGTLFVVSTAASVYWLRLYRREGKP